MPPARQYFMTLAIILAFDNGENGLVQQQHTALATIGSSFNYNKTLIRLLTAKMDLLNVNLMQTTASRTDLVESLLAAVDVPVIINFATNTTSVPRHRPHGRIRSFNYFFLLESQQVNATLQRFGNRAGLYMIGLMDVADFNELHAFAHDLWLRKGIYRIFYMLGQRTMVYNPFALSHGGYGLIQNLNEVRLFDFLHNWNLNNYPLRVYIFDSVYSTTFGNGTMELITHATGADAETAYLLAKKMNFSMKLQWPDDEYFGARLENGSYNGAIGRLSRYETDITLTGFFVKDYLTSDIEFSVPVYMDQLCCYVMKAKRIPQSLMPLFAVDGNVWLGFFLMGLISAFAWIVLRRLNLKFAAKLHISQNNKMSSKCEYLRILTDTCCCWVRVSLERLPPFFTERILMVSLCLVSVIFGAVFESSLATVYIRPLYYNDINTLRELDEANFKIYIKHPAMKDDLFYGTNSALWDHLNTKLVLVGETEERLISMMAKRGGFCAVTRASSLILDDIRYFITKKIHMIPECPKQYHIAFVYPKHSPYEKIFNFWILKFIDAGLINYWIDRMKYQARISIHKYADYNADYGNAWKVLTLDDLQLSFYALLFGCTVAGIVFLVEICVGRWRK